MSVMPIEDLCEDMARSSPTQGGQYAVAFAILKLAKAQESCAMWLKYLGNGDASTHMGAIEAFGLHMGEKIEHLGAVISEAIEGLNPAL